MPEVFISYSRRDQDFVRRLAQRLEAMERSIWIDWEDIPWTADWWQEIRQGIEASDNFVFVVSPNSLSSVVCTLEVAYAIANNKRLVPLVYQDAPPDDALATLSTKELDDVAQKMLNGRDILQLSSANWQKIARHNWLFAKEENNFDEAIQNLIEAIDTDLDHRREHTRLLMRAVEWDNNQRDTSMLLDGTEIQRAREWLMQAGSKEPAPADLHNAYIFSSENHAATQQRRLLLGVTTALVVAVALSVLSAVLWQQASAERDRADLQAQISESGRVALQGLLELENTQFDRALLLGLEALQIDDTVEANSTLLTSLQRVPQLTRFLHDHNETWVRATDYHPAGTQFATADVDGTLLLWDATVNPPTSTALVWHERGIWDIAYSPDGGWVASADEGGNIAMWNTNTGELVRWWQSEPNVQIFTLAFHPDGNILATGAAETFIRLWNVNDGTEIGAFDGHADWVSKVTFSDDGTMLASGGRAAQIILWDVVGNALEQRHLITEHENWVFALDFHPDSTVFASGAADGTLRLWDVETGEIIGTPVTDHLGWIRAVEFSNDGTQLVTGSQDKRIILRDPQTGRRVRGVAPLDGHAGEVFDVTFSPNGNEMISGDQEGNVLVWNPPSLQPFSTPLAELDGEIYAVRYNADATKLMAASTTGEVNFLDSTTGDRVDNTLTTEREVVDAVYAPDGTQFAYSTAAGQISLRDAASGAEIAWIIADDGPTWDVAFHPTEALLMSVGEDGVLRFWNTADGTLAREQELPTDVALNALAINSSLNVFAIGDAGGTVFIWNEDSQMVQHTLTSHTDAVTALVFNRAGDKLASASRDNTVIVWDAAAGTMLGQPLTEHTNWVLDVAFSPDDQILATGSRDETIILWDVSTLRSIGLPFSNSGGWVRSVAFSPDGSTLMTGSRSGKVDAWSINVNNWRQRACVIANRTLDSVEITQFLGDAPSSLACSNGIS